MDKENAVKTQGQKGGIEQMTLDEAIKRAEEVIVESLEKTEGRNASDPIAIKCGERAEEHRQLAEWLKELKQLREQTMEKEIIDSLPTVNVVIPNNATNGDVIQALFPNIDKGFSNVIDLNLWWNAKCKAELDIIDELEKIKAEIEQDAFKDVNGSKYIFVNRVNQIIDKYKAELKGENK